MSDELQLDDVGLHADEDQVVVEIKVTNDSERTIHAHVTPRKIRYDLNTRKLAVELTDENLQRDLVTTHHIIPKFKAVDPHSSATIRIRLPRIMHRLGEGAADSTPTIETLPIYEAGEVEVTMAWSDTPFYPDPRASSSGVIDDLINWMKGSVRGRGRAAS